jgi:hypothetical protein
MRNEAPSCRLGNVSCGAVATGTVSFRKVLTLPLRAFTNVARGAAVHVPRTLLNRLVASCRCVAEPMARSSALAAVSVAHSPA